MWLHFFDKSKKGKYNIDYKPIFFCGIANFICTSNLKVSPSIYLTIKSFVKWPIFRNGNFQLNNATIWRDIGPISWYSRLNSAALILHVIAALVKGWCWSNKSKVFGNLYAFSCPILLIGQSFWKYHSEKGRATKSDEFSEKFQISCDHPPSFSENYVANFLW